MSKTQQVANLRKARAERAEPATKVEKTAKATRKPSATKTVVDRSPLAIGEFISRPGGASMAEIEERFQMAAHPLRTKIFTARHQLKFAITYDPVKKRYFGKAPKRKAA